MGEMHLPSPSFSRSLVSTLPFFLFFLFFFVPPGFQLVFLPFADDIRQITDQYFNREQADDTQIAAAADMIEHARIPGTVLHETFLFFLSVSSY